MANPASLNSPRYAFVPTATSAAVASSILLPSSGNLYGVNAYSSAAGFLLIIDSATVPANGATVMPKKVFAIPAGGTIAYDFPLPVRFVNGCVALFSSNPSPYTYTASATAFISGDVA